MNLTEETELLTMTRLSKRGSCYPIVIEGELDVYTSPWLREELAAILRSEDSDFRPGDRIVIHTESGEFVADDGNLFFSAGIKYIDASGLGAMIAGFKRARKGDGTVCLIISDQRVRRIFEITGLDRVFAIYENAKAFC